MSVIQPDRPWYCRNAAVDEYKQTLTTDSQELSVLKTLKITRAIIVNLGVIAITLFAIAEGGDVTLFGLLGLSVLGGYNGLEISDYAALLQAYREVQSDTPDRGDE
jgi:hypothetical protein